MTYIKSLLKSQESILGDFLTKMWCLLCTITLGTTHKLLSYVAFTCYSLWYILWTNLGFYEHPDATDSPNIFFFYITVYDVLEVYINYVTVTISQK